MSPYLFAVSITNYENLDSPSREVNNTKCPEYQKSNKILKVHHKNLRIQKFGPQNKT